MSEKFANNKFSVMVGGKEIVCDILFTHHSEQTGKDYMAFTDHSKAPDGSASVFYATYDPNAESIDLVPIQTQSEWVMMREMFEQIQEDAAREMIQQFRQAMGAGEEPKAEEEKAE
ncbi:MAG: DUF1292 domain-containing protein [Oscillospiraceae bacterium]|nr:DUF1292 domain-containing protein [Oscillospiraceae bacterium]